MGDSDTMWSHQVLFVVASLAITFSKAQLVDNFVCPDEFEGYYPHLYSCDRYWKCIDGRESLETCGNGLAFDDLDPTFTTENCDYVYNVDCGNRTELEPAISAPNCPRLYGTFMDPDDCTGFFNCRNGIANRYSCAPGLAFDPEDRVCKWADQVSRCKKLMDEEEKKGVLQCPQNFLRGVNTKHPHPQDCRQFFVCISGTAREYGCPLGSVFKITQNEDGVCADPADVAECANYYGDLQFQPEELVKAGVDPEASGSRLTLQHLELEPPTELAIHLQKFNCQKMTSLMHNFARLLLTIGGLSKILLTFGGPFKRTPESWYQPNLCPADSGRDHPKPQPLLLRRRQQQLLLQPLQQPQPDH